MKRFILTLASLCLIGNIWAYDFTVNGIYYKINSMDTNTVEVTDSLCATSKLSGNPSLSGSYSGDVVIPASVVYGEKIYSVSYLTYSAFNYSNGLTSLTIPSTVTYIDAYDGYSYPSAYGANSFYNCTNLSSINVEPGSKSFCSIDGILFSKDSTKIIVYPIGKEGRTYTIPSKVDRIYCCAFENTSLTSIIIPKTVTSIWYAAFRGCSKLDSITINSDSLSIELQAFSRCKSLKQITCNTILPPTCISSDADIIFGTDELSKAQIYAQAKLSVPQASLKLYQLMNPWKNFYIESVAKLTNSLANEVKLSVQNNLIIIKGVQRNERITVYSSQGLIIYKGKATGDEMIFSVSAHGVYVVKIGKESFKVIY